MLTLLACSTVNMHSGDRWVGDSERTSDVHVSMVFMLAPRYELATCPVASQRRWISTSPLHDSVREKKSGWRWLNGLQSQPTLTSTALANHQCFILKEGGRANEQTNGTGWTSWWEERGALFRQSEHRFTPSTHHPIKSCWNSSSENSFKLNLFLENLNN